MNAIAPSPVRFLLAVGAGLHADAPPMARVACRAGEPVRLNHLGAILPSGASPVRRGETSEVLREALKRLCEPWDRNAQRLIDRYFGFLERGIEAAGIEIDKRLAPFAGLYRPRDTLFSAAAPLPRARLLALGLDEIAVPIVFWTGGSLVALFDAASGETPRRRVERDERLRGAGVDLARLPPAASPAEDDAFFAGILGPDLTRFFATERLPAAPLPAAHGTFATTRNMDHDMTGASA